MFASVVAMTMVTTVTAVMSSTSSNNIAMPMTGPKRGVQVGRARTQARQARIGAYLGGAGVSEFQISRMIIHLPFRR